MGPLFLLSRKMAGNQGVKSMEIRVKRAYDPPEQDDGARVLVDRIWPRGLSKQRLQLTVWLRGLAPSTELRRWFGHDPRKWEEFRRRYCRELEECPEVVDALRARLEQGRVTLVYAASDQQHNNAVVLKEYLESTMRS
jgi:uncharacterized protein YeaO (DUF488 family)